MKDRCEKVIVGFCCVFVFLLIVWTVCNSVNVCMYERGVYDCSDMAIRDQQIFTKLGLDADVAMNSEMEHAWVVVKIHGKDIHWESTALQPISHRDYTKRLTVIQVRSCSMNPVKLFPEWCLIGQKGIL